MLDFFLVGDGVPRRAKKLLASGEAARARVVGILVYSRAESPDRWEYALEAAGSRGSFRAGARQHLTPQGERAHLGAGLTVRHDGERVAVDWTASMAAWGHAGVGQSASGWAAADPPPNGVDDRRDPFRAPAGDPVTAELTAVGRAGGVASVLGAWDLVLTVGGDAISWRAVNVPAYAVHLLVPGARLPATRQGDRVAVDWQRAAVETAPAGPFDFDALLPEPAPADEAIGDMDAWMAGFDRWKK